MHERKVMKNLQAYCSYYIAECVHDVYESKSRETHKYSTPDASAIDNEKCIIICQWFDSEAGKM